MIEASECARWWMVPSSADWIEDVQDEYPDPRFQPNPPEVLIEIVPAEAGVVPGWATQKGMLRSIWEGDR